MPRLKGTYVLYVRILLGYILLYLIYHSETEGLVFRISGVRLPKGERASLNSRRHVKHEV